MRAPVSPNRRLVLSGGTFLPGVGAHPPATTRTRQAFSYDAVTGPSSGETHHFSPRSAA